MIASGAGAVSLDAIGSPTTIALTFAVLFALSFLFSGTETAFFSLQERDRRRIAEGNSATDRRSHGLLRNRADLITTILMGNETVNVAISALAAGIAALMLPGQEWVVVLIVTPVLVLLSEITPKIIAFRLNRRWVTLATWPITILSFLLWPLRFVISGVVKAIARAFGVSDTEAVHRLGEEEFLVLVEQGAEQGLLKEDARDMIEAVFELDDMHVVRLMTPRPDVFALPIDITWDELLAACRSQGYSRVPIFEDSIDNIIGVLLVKDLLRHRRKPLVGPDALRELLLEPVFVPSSKPASAMMRDMLRRRIHMAFVADEHGSLMGLISLDDLIIELVGELRDNDDEHSTAVERNGGVLTVRATTDVDDFEEETGIELPSGRYHTVGGFVFHTLGRVPRVGDEVVFAEHVFLVEEMEGRRVASVRVSPLAAAQEASA